MSIVISPTQTCTDRPPTPDNKSVKKISSTPIVQVQYQAATQLTHSSPAKIDPENGWPQQQQQQKVFLDVCSKEKNGDSILFQEICCWCTIIVVVDDVM